MTRGYLAANSLQMNGCYAWLALGSSLFFNKNSTLSTQEPEKLPKDLQQRIKTKVYELAENPRPTGVVKLENSDLHPTPNFKCFLYLSTLQD
ncbi:hypothetical protein NUACC21_35140 [Scytonema sp. NUACC21]